MAVKVYQYVRGDSQRLLLRTAKTTIEVNFKGGNTFKGIRPELTTSNALVQYAIENYSRFGKDIILVSIDGVSPEDYAKNSGKKDEEQSASASSDNGKATKVKQVKSVKTFNDAVDYFANLGVAVESEEQVSELCEEYNVSFPNLK